MNKVKQHPLKSPPLKFRISTLPVSGVTLQDKLNLEDLNSRMNESTNNDTIFISAPSFTVKLRRAPFGAEGSGAIFGQYTQTCCRCLEPKERQLDLSFNFIVKERPDPNTIEDDLSLLYSDDDYIDLKQYLEELLILKLDPFWSPNLDASEKCSLCNNWSCNNSSGNNSRCENSSPHSPAGQTDSDSSSDTSNSLGSLLTKALLKR